MLVFNNYNIEIEKLETQKDILYTKCQIFNLELKILLLYTFQQETLKRISKETT